MRRLIVCADGTWNTPDRTDEGVPAPSNVVKMARGVLPQASDGTCQIVLYHRGLGTDNLIDKLTGGAFGIGLSRNVRDIYLFLVHNFSDGDEIYLFGFSRGAYTVRSTAGLIRKVGLVRKEHADKDLKAWQIYRERRGGPDSAEAKGFREAFSRYPVRIKFIGVWDTVGALGIPGLLNFIGRARFQFHDVALSRSVDNAFQALAIDEKRRFFKPTLWQQHPEASGQVLQQAWFPGVHMDVGGGYGDQTLADIALVWLTEKARATGLQMDDTIPPQAPQGTYDGRLHESRTFPYTVIPAYWRLIGAGVPGERSVYEGGPSREVLAEATRLRYNNDPSYRPRNLVEYIEGGAEGPSESP